MDINELTKEQKDTILTHFRNAIRCRMEQWGHERAIELILEKKLDYEVVDWAVNYDDGSSITWEDFLEAAL